MISYDILEKNLKDKGIGKTELSTQLGISTRTIAKIGKVKNFQIGACKR